MKHNEEPIRKCTKQSMPQSFGIVPSIVHTVMEQYGQSVTVRRQLKVSAVWLLHLCSESDDVYVSTTPQQEVCDGNVLLLFYNQHKCAFTGCYTKPTASFPRAHSAIDQFLKEALDDVGFVLEDIVDTGIQAFIPELTKVLQPFSCMQRPKEEEEAEEAEIRVLMYQI